MKKISAYCWQDGPFSLPDMGKGKFNSEDSDVVERATLIRPVVAPTSIRAWPQRVLLLHGKDGCTQVDFDRARGLATELVIRNQQIYAAQEAQQQAQQALQFRSHGADASATASAASGCTTAADDVYTAAADGASTTVVVVACTSTFARRFRRR